MWDKIWTLIYRFGSSRGAVLITVFVVFAAIIISRLFVLQIIHGEDYQENYNLKIERQESIDATRGNIYDRNGNLLAYNELSFAVTIEDSGTYRNESQRNEALNTELCEIITHLEQNGDTIDHDFGIVLDERGQFVFTNTGTALQRFRADIFGKASINDLGYNRRLSLNEAEATADEIMDYLIHVRYDIPDEYDKKMQLEIAVIRFRMGLNSYQKYISTTIALDVSKESMAFVKENAYRLEGADVEEKTIRVYPDAECFASILGYTGKISTEEYEELSQWDDSYTLNDIIGKAGIEQYMNKELMGTKGFQTVYVDSLGNLIETAEHTDPIPGGDVYLSIDRDLQINAYHLLEQEIAGILYSKIENIKEYYTTSETSASDIIIPIYDVYYALIDNHLINKRHLSSFEATEVEQSVQQAFEAKQEETLNILRGQLSSTHPPVYDSLPDEYQVYATYIVRMLKSMDVFDEDAIDNSDAMQVQWMSEQLSVQEYLKHVIERGWIDITAYMEEEQYVDSDELYAGLVDFVIETLREDENFSDLMYKYAILEDRISGNQLCALLYDQGILPMDAEARRGLLSGEIDAYSFMREKIRSLEITPGQLGLDPCSGSFVAIDPRTGEVLACVTYPGYDSNRLANSLDSSYYAYLNANNSTPLYNHATQERTAPGSTFKPVTAAAGLSYQVIDPSVEIHDDGIFDKVDNTPRCWFYPDSHGDITVAEALRDSCNYFFYEVGYRLSGGELFHDSTGIERLGEFASAFGLDEKTGLEIEENEPQIADEYPVMAAIGQSNHNFTTVSLARYVAAVANNGTVYNLTLLDHLTDAEGNVTETFSPRERNSVSGVSPLQWETIHFGMRMVVEELPEFADFPVMVAGKTGTAQQVNNRPNHALFICYAPYDTPEIAMAARIPFGYTSHNAAELCNNIIGTYYHVEGYEDIVSGEANEVSTTNAVTD